MRMLVCMEQGGTGHAGERLGEADHPGPGVNATEVHVPLFM